ncbi:MAG TPA: DMT family transporter, partial [Nocardioidaceae bacterium]|nr:DMT family transporter [Nocardioidaceae bacterium]
MQERRAYAAIGITLVLWASAFVAIRHLGEDFSPGALSLGRQLVAAIALAFVVFARGMTAAPRRSDWPSLLAIGVLWFAVYHVALNEAEQRVDAGTASMLLQVSPILLTVLAIAFLGERATSGLVIGLLVSFAGVTLIGFSTSDGSNGDLVGVLLCLVSCLAYAVSVVLQKPLLRRLPALELTWIATVVGTLVTLPFLPQLVDEAQQAPVSSVYWLIYLGLFPTALAFTTYAFALTHLSASTLGLSTYLVPPITVLIAWVALGETPPPLAYVGGVLCLA